MAVVQIPNLTAAVSVTGAEQLEAVQSGSTVRVTIDQIRQIASSTPASASATGTAGTVTYDSSYIYVCIATNTWKRAALTTW